MEENKNLVTNDAAINNTEMATEKVNTVNNAIKLSKPETVKPTPLEIGILSFAALGVVETTGLIIYLGKTLYDKWKEDKNAKDASEKPEKKDDDSSKPVEESKEDKEDKKDSE